MHLFLLYKNYLFFGWAGSLLLSLGFSLVAVLRLLVAVASLVAEHRLKGVWASAVATLGLSSCGAWA